MTGWLMTAARRSARRHLWAGFGVAALMVGGVGAWAAVTNIAGAVVSQGVVVVESNVRKVQHSTGGIVGEIRVRDGDRVKLGEILIRLDETITRANLGIVTRALDELAARKARLEAERDGAASVAFPDDLLQRTGEKDIALIVSGERALFELRRAARMGQKSQLGQRIGQLEEEVGGHWLPRQGPRPRRSSSYSASSPAPVTFGTRISCRSPSSPRSSGKPSGSTASERS